MIEIESGSACILSEFSLFTFLIVPTLRRAHVIRDTWRTTRDTHLL